MNGKPKRQHFHMTQIKWLNGVVEFKATLDLIDGQETYKPKLHDSYPIQPSPHMTDILDQMKNPLATTHGLLDVENVVHQKEFNGQEFQKKLAVKHTTEKLKDINVSGCIISGEDKRRGVKITGTNRGLAINSPKLLFVGTKYGFEKDLEDLADALEDELYEFVFNGKKAQLSAFEPKSNAEPAPKSKDKKPAAKKKEAPKKATGKDAAAGAGVEKD